MIALAWHALARRRLRVLLVLGAIALAVAGFVAISGLAKGYLATWGVLHDEHGSQVVAFERGVVELMSSRLPADLAARVRAIPGVAGASPMLTRVFSVRAGGHNLIVTGADATAALWRNLDLASGRPPRDGAQMEIVLGARAAAVLELAVDDRLQIRGHDVAVVGIARFSGAMNSGGGFMRLDPMQTAARRPGAVTYLSIELVGDRSPEAMLPALDAAFPIARFYRGQSVAGKIRINQVFVFVVQAIAGVALVVGVLSVVNTLAVAVAESKRDYAVLIALGWQPWRITTVVLVQSALLSLTGTLVGTGIGLALLFSIAAHPRIAAFVEPELAAGDRAAMVLWIALAGSLASLVPALRAARQDPAAVLAQV